MIESDRGSEDGARVKMLKDAQGLILVITSYHVELVPSHIPVFNIIHRIQTCSSPSADLERTFSKAQIRRVAHGCLLHSKTVKRASLTVRTPF